MDFPNLPNREWKEIPSLKGYYASNYGEIYSAPKLRKFGKQRRITPPLVLSLRKHRNGYMTVNIGGENKYVHRLVAEAFLENPNEFPEVNHKDEDKANNKVENLEWCDRKYNANYGTGRIRLKEKLIKRYSVINLDAGDIYESPLAACKSTGIHNDSISKVCKGKGKKAGGYRWRYLNG